MTLTAPYGQNNYMGEYTSDTNCLTFIRNNKWDSSGDGTGDPQNGMWYYNTTDHLIHEYRNGYWETEFSDAISSGGNLILEAYNTTVNSPYTIFLRKSDNNTLKTRTPVSVDDELGAIWGQTPTGAIGSPFGNSVGIVFGLEDTISGSAAPGWMEIRTQLSGGETSIWYVDQNYVKQLVDLWMNGKKLMFDSDRDTYFISPSDDTIDLYRGGSQRYRWDTSFRTYLGARMYQYNSSGTEYGYQYRTDTEWLFYTSGAYITLNSGTGVSLKRAGSTMLGCYSTGTNVYNGNFIVNGSYYIQCLDTYTRSVSGRNVYVSSGGVYGYLSSSIRYKDVLGDIEDVSWIHKLKPVKFNYKEDPHKTLWLGFIAEDVEEVYPELVDYNQEGEVDTVDYQKLIAPMVKEIQNLRKELDEVKTELEVLKSQNA